MASYCECALLRYVPLGLQKWFHRCKITNVKELDWWQSIQHRGSPVTVTVTPAQVFITHPSNSMAAAMLKRLDCADRYAYSLLKDGICLLAALELAHWNRQEADSVGRLCCPWREAAVLVCW